MVGKIFKIFIIGFLKTMFVIFCMIACGVAGYFGTRYYYSQKNVTSVHKESTATRDDLAKHLMFVWNQETEKIAACVLEVFDSEGHTLAYITIPTKGQMMLSAELYQKLSQISEEVPQVVRMSRLCTYFDSKDEAYDYGVVMLEDIFSIDISYYSVIPSEDFKKCFKVDKVRSGKGRADGRVLRKSFLEEMADEDEDSLKDYLEEACKRMQSNLSTKDRLSYAGDYIEVSPDQIQYYVLPVTQTGSEQTIDLEKSAAIFEKCNVDGSALTGGAATTGDNISAPELKNIVILNSTSTAGVAKQWSEVFEEQGYHVADIGNYSPEMEKTRIVVRKEGQGEEFLDYFNDVEIRTGNVPEGADAQIIIGSADIEVLSN